MENKPDWENLLYVMELSDFFPVPLESTDESGQRVTTKINDDSIIVTTYHHNNTVDSKIYWSDRTIEENYTGERKND